MTKPALTHRLAAWALAGALLLWGVSAFISQAGAARQNAEQTTWGHDARMAQLKRLLAVDLQAAGIEKAPNLANMFIQADSDGLAAAQMQQQLSALTRNAGAKVQRIIALEDIQGSGQPAIRLQFTQDWAGLIQLLAQLEAHQPAYAVRSLTISRSRRATPETDPVLQIRLDLAGLRPEAS